MRKMMAAVSAGLLCLSVAHAQDTKSGEKAATAAPPKVSSALIEKIRGCQTQAEKKHLKGDERKIFVSRCIDGSDAAPRIAAARAMDKAREKRARCIKLANARQLRGEERKKFLSECPKN